jgi:DnaJ family protein A protein 2
MAFNPESDDYYEVLGVSKTATTEEIEKARKKAILLFHPDKNLKNKEQASKNLIKVEEAFQVLNDPDKREIYDKYGKEALDEQNMMNGGRSASDMNDILKNIFSSMGGMPPGMGGMGGIPGMRNMRNMFRSDDNGNDEDDDDIIPPVKCVIDLELSELYIGKTMRHSVDRGSLCKNCDGTGSEDKIDHTCKTCKGNGFIVKVQQMGPMIQQMQQKCNKCNGQGKTKSFSECKTCSGNKVIVEQYDFELTIPQGAFTKYCVKIPNQGNEIPIDQRKGAHTRTDLEAYIREKRHDTFTHMFTIEGKKDESDPADLLINIHVNLAESLCGFYKTIQHLDNNDINFHHDSLVKNGDIIIIKGKGMPVLGSDKFGDLYCSITVDYPMQKIPDDKRKRLWQLLTGTSYQLKDNNINYEPSVTLDSFTEAKNKGKKGKSKSKYPEDGNGENIQCAQS